jgi:hypothetical protein
VCPKVCRTHFIGRTAKTQTANPRFVVPFSLAQGKQDLCHAFFYARQSIFFLFPHVTISKGSRVRLCCTPTKGARKSESFVVRFASDARQNKLCCAFCIRRTAKTLLTP